MSKSPAWGRGRGSVCETVAPVAKLLTALDPVPPHQLWGLGQLTYHL